MAKNPKVPATLTPTDDKRGVDVKVKTPAIVLEIIEVSWKSGIDVARNKTKIVAPHWRLADNVVDKDKKVTNKVEEEDKPDALHFKTGSQKPGVYLVKSKKGADSFEVKIKVTKNTTELTAGKLGGKLGTLSFESDCALSVGEHVVQMKFIELPEVLTHAEGDASWQLTAKTQTIPVSTKTRLELFIVFDKPMSFYTDGVWAEALRFVFKKAGVSSSSKPEDAAKKVTAYCHTGHGMRYDTRQGAPAFFSGSSSTGMGYMSLWNYMLKIPANIVNCYDQAASVQSFVGALGIQTNWYYLKPYGYINTTNLIGVGPCNNPFFESNGSKSVVASDSTERTAFGNHAFIGFKGKILDSCAGPHTGTETPRRYLEVSIDAFRTTTELKITTVTAPATLGSYLEAGYLKNSTGLTAVE